jgi:hypothetical protein
MCVSVHYGFGGIKENWKAGMHRRDRVSDILKIDKCILENENENYLRKKLNARMTIKRE